MSTRTHSKRKDTPSNERATPSKARMKNPNESAASSLLKCDPREAIAVAAYYLAERRGFVSGHEMEDWLEAEAQLRSALPPSRIDVDLAH
jgi:hypothetical protein